MGADPGGGFPRSLGSGWYNLSSTNSPGRRSIQRPGPVSDSRPVPPLQWVVHSDNARSAGTSACLGRGIPDQARIRGGVTLEESLGLEPAQPVAQQSIRDAGHGDADVAEPPGSGEHCEQDAARPSAADEFQRLLQAEAVAGRPLSGSAALLRHWSIMTFRFVARNLWPETTPAAVTSPQGTPTPPSLTKSTGPGVAGAPGEPTRRGGLVSVGELDAKQPR